MCARVRPRARARMCRPQLQFSNCFSCPYLFIVPRGCAGTGLGLSIAASAFSCPYLDCRIAGTGLGLSIARDLALAHGGDISVTSQARPSRQAQLRMPLARLRLTRRRHACGVGWFPGRRVPGRDVPGRDVWFGGWARRCVLHRYRLHGDTPVISLAWRHPCDSACSATALWLGL